MLYFYRVLKNKFFKNLKIMKTKVCIRCNIEKDITLFRTRKTSSDGRSSTCKECTYGHPPLKRYTKNTKELVEKECLICKQILKIERFSSFTKGDKIYYQSSCKTCRTRNYNEPNKKKNKVGRRRRLKKAYGINEEIYQMMLKTQNNSCKICGHVIEKGKVLYVDHCHTTGKVRGLLCPHCNSGLGMFKDNIENLKAAIQYLQQNKE